MTGNFVSLYKTRKKGETSILKLKCGWINSELNILVIEGNTAWSGKFTTEEIESFCELLGITRDEYVTECQQAFSGGEAVEHFLFAVENNRFVWRKELEADTRVKFGSIRLSPVPLVQALEEFVDFAFETIERDRKEVTDAKNKMGYYETERATLVQKLEEYTQKKNEMENILYSKFLCVLNAKKERIAILEKELSDLKSKIQPSTNQTESEKCDTAVPAKRSSKRTRETKKTTKPNKHRVQQSTSSVSFDTELQMLSNIPSENSDTQTTHSSTNKKIVKLNVRQKGENNVNTNPSVENRTTSPKKEDSDPCTSKTFDGKGCEPGVLENTDYSQLQASKTDTLQQKTLVVRSTSPIASTSSSGIPLENHIPVKYETPVSDEEEMCIPSQVHADQKSQLSVKRSVDDFVSKQNKNNSGSIYSSEEKDKTTGKISEVICPIDLVSQKINTRSELSLNNVNKLTISKSNKKVHTSPAKQSKAFEIISPLDLLGQSKPVTPSLVHKDTDSMPTNNSLKQPIQSVNMQDSSSNEYPIDRTNVCQEPVEGSAGRVDISCVNRNYTSNTEDATSVTMSCANHTKSDTKGESNHYDSDTDVDEPEDVCKLSAKHRSFNDIPEDSNYSSLAGSETPEAKGDEIHHPEQRKAIDNLLNDSQDADSSSEEVPTAALPKRTRRSERINKCVPIANLKSKIQPSTNQTESEKCDTAVPAKRSSKRTRETKKTTKPNKRRVQQSTTSVSFDTELQMLSNIPSENNDTQTIHSSTNKKLVKRNVRQKGENNVNTNPSVENRTTSLKKEDSDPCTSKTFDGKGCEPEVLENTDFSQLQASKTDTLQQKSVVVRSTSPVASTSTSGIPLENHIPVKYESDTKGEINHYDSETDVDEPEDVCKLSAKHRCFNDIPEDSNYSSLAGSETSEAKGDEIHHPEQKKAIDILLNDSQDADSSSEEIPTAALPKRTHRAERINKCVPIASESVNQFTKLNNIQEKSQSVSENGGSVFYEQETQLVDTQKLLDELG